MMWIIEGVLAGLMAGAIMGCISQLGYWLGILKSHLIVIDGKFALRKIQLDITPKAVYYIGIFIHLVTSIIFGIIYVFIAELVGFEPRTIWPIAVYVLVLWLAMLFSALPIAGQGFLGSKVSRYAWLEQLVLHIIFGFSFWWGLGIV
jgi:uncharacterized membrane protein YagU involved in acid resistance